jgi:hypothetical protein
LAGRRTAAVVVVLVVVVMMVVVVVVEFFSHVSIACTYAHMFLIRTLGVLIRIYGSLQERLVSHMLLRIETVVHQNL